MPVHEGVHTGVTTLHRVPSVEQAGVVDGQLPHVPPHPSLPHTLPAHCFVHTAGMTAHVPAVEQEEPAAQVPQVPPHPLLPQVLPLHWGVHELTHRPAALHVWPAAQEPVGLVPQNKPQPSLPQVFAAPVDVVHCLAHVGTVVPWHVPWPSGPDTRHLYEVVGVLAGHAPHVPPHPSLPQEKPLQEGVQVDDDSHFWDVNRLFVVRWTHDEPGAHVPHVPPQPSLPQV